MILIYHCVSYHHRNIHSGDDTSRKSYKEMVRKEHQSAKGHQVITLNLAITLRVTLVGDFVKSFLTLYIYIISENVFLYKKIGRASCRERVCLYV